MKHLSSNNSLLNEHIIEANKQAYSNTVNSNEHSNIDTNANNRYEVPGYDTVCYWVEQSDVPEIDFMAELPCRMEKLPEERKKADGRIFLRGFIEGMALDVYPNGVSIRVSLPKLLLGNNIESILLDEVNRAHNRISELLGFSIYKAKVTRIDLSATFIVLHPFNSYLQSLGQLTRFHDETDKNGRYYFNRKERKMSPIVLLFYNKLQEQESKGVTTNVAFQNSFRYEIRFRKFKQSLKRKSVSPLDLEDSIFFKFLINKWLKYFNNISIYNDLKLDVDFLSSAKIFSAFFMVTGITSFGQDRLLKDINDRMKLGIISKQKGCRFKHKIKKLIQSNKLSKENELINELNEKMEKAYHYYT